MKKKNQPLFVDFYNLHLDCCLTIVPRTKIDANEFWYRTRTPEEVKEEFEMLRGFGLMPRSIDIQHEWKAKIWIKRGNKFVLERQENQENIDEKDVSYPVFPEQKWARGLAIVAINPPSAEMKVKIIEFFRNIPKCSKVVDSSVFGSMIEYKSRFGVDWFDSRDFLDFMFDYFCFRKLIDGYIEGKISTWTLEWFQEKIQEYRYSLQIWKDNELIKLFTLNSDEISLDSLNFKQRGIHIEGLPYRLYLGAFLLNIHLQIAQTLEEKKEIKRCVAYKTLRTEACQNVFVDEKKQGPPQHFCSVRCRRRIHKHEMKYHEDKIKRLRGEW